MGKKKGTTVAALLYVFVVGSAHGGEHLTVFLCLLRDSLEVFVQSLLEEVVLHIQLLLAGHVHGVDAEI